MTDRDVELVLDASAELGEAPIWDPEASTLIWVDITAGVVHRIDPGNRAGRGVRRRAPVGAAVPTSAGRLALAANDGFLLLDPATGAIEPIAEVEVDSAAT